MMNPTLTKASFLMLFRNKQAFYFNLVLPVIIMLVFGLVSGNSTVLGGSLTYKNFVIPGLITLALMQMAIFSVAFLLARHKEKGVLKKLMTTPLRPAQFLQAEIGARLVMATVQVLLLVSVAVLLLSFTFVGNYFYLLAAAILGALVFLTLGFVVAGLAKSMETVPAIANAVTFPMLFLGDIFFPTETLPAWLRPVADNLPVTYLASALRDIMLTGKTLWEVKGFVLGLFLWLLVFFLIAAKVFKMKEA